MKPENLEAIYELSPMQQGMLFDSINAPESGVYCIHMSFALQGDLNLSAFRRAWKQVIKRFPVLRSSYHWEEIDKFLQVVHKQVALPLERHDWREHGPSEQAKKLEAFLEVDRLRGFDLTQAPLMRLILIQMSETSYQFVLSYHHLIMDGWSTALLLKDLFAFYQAYCQGQNLRLPRSRPYSDYIGWLQQQDLGEAEAFWRNRLAGFTTATALGVERVPVNVYDDGTNFLEHGINLSPEFANALQFFARQHQLTLNTLLQGAWSLLLSRYSGENDVVYGTVVSGRPPALAGANSMVGLFINTLPVRVQLTAEEPLIPWLKHLQDEQLEARQFEYSPLVQVQEWSDVARGQSLFESIVVFENYPIGEGSSDNQTLKISDLEVSERVTFPISLWSRMPTEQNAEVSLRLRYNAHRFDSATVELMLVHLQTMLEDMVVNPDKSLADLSLLTETERHRLLVDLNETAVSYPQDQCLHQLLETQAKKTPAAIAVTFEGEQTTYQALNERTNQLAHYLRALGVGPGKFVGVYVERSIEMIVGLLGILKAGGAYLPMDPTFPEDRLAYMLENSETAVILTQENLVNTDFVQQSGIEAICLDRDWSQIAEQPVENLPNVTQPHHLAYVIYTSGSTGKPKGVQIPHKAAVNFLYSMEQEPGLQADDNLLAITTLSFDISVLEIFLPLLMGAKIVLANREQSSDGYQLAALMEDAHVTMAQATPATWKMLLASGWEGDPKLKVLCGGEAMPRDLADQLLPNVAELWNVYGPTETTVWSTVHRVTAVTNQISVGRPIANTQIYLLDENMQPVPTGVPGEMYIGGDGVSSGYLNRPELTAEQFILDPFSNKPDAMLYKTGDAARYLPDGNIIFIGRLDFQVKIRGYRIELGEVEAVLDAVTAVRESVVIAHEDSSGDKRLVAYYIPTGDTQPDVNELRSILQESLPSYMVPAIFIQMDAFPLTPNRKVDRKALPAPEIDQTSLDHNYIAPRSETEETIAQIMADVLKLEQVGILANFFEIGGHSLLAAQFISRVQKELDVEIPLRTLFECPTVAGFAQTLSGVEIDTTSGLTSIEPVERDGQLSLSFAQQRLWFFDQFEPESSAYHMPIAMRLTGTLHVAALEQSLQMMIDRHEILRTTFVQVNDEPIQKIHTSLPVELKQIDLRSVPVDEREEVALKQVEVDINQPFDLVNGPLQRVTLFCLDDTDHIMLFVQHHIITDGWSMTLTWQELTSIYKDIVAGKLAQLSPLPIQYADYAQWQREWMQGDVLERQLSYWKKQLGGRLPVLELPTDYPRAALQTNRGAKQPVVFSEALTNSLNALSQKEHTTLFITLLTAFNVLLSRYSGQTDITVGSPIAGRSRAELEGLIGFFVNTLVLRTDLSENLSFRELLAQVHEVALAAFDNQDVPFEKLVEELQPKRDMSRTPLFQVMFALQNVPTSNIELDNLTFENLDISSETAMFDLSLTMHESEQGLRGAIDYNSDLYEDDTILRMVGHLHTLLEGIVANPDQPIAELPLLTPFEQNQLFVEWNNTYLDYPKDKRIYQLIENQAEQNPNAVAVQHEQEQITYQQLNMRANQLAHYLQQQGVGPDVIVGLSIPRSIDMIVSVLAVLKAGGAYLPLDPAYPVKRLQFMVEDAKPIAILTRNDVDWVELCEENVAIIELSDWHTFAQYPTQNLETVAASHDLAYIIYTSGSTGIPKGVPIEHGAKANYIHGSIVSYLFSGDDRVLQFATIAFDTAVEEIFSCLTVGATLVLRTDTMIDTMSHFLAKCEEWGVTVLDLPTAFWHHLTNSLVTEKLSLPKCINRTIIGGEKANELALHQWQQYVGPEVPLFNGYGPTEATVGATIYKAGKELDAETVSRGMLIGKAMPNYTLYVLDAQMQPVPIGVAGELLIGGASLARGYLNRPELTAEKFVNNPFGAGRLYRTGDLVRYMPDGNIEFIGRTDDQVKIRGYRIELGEIESALSKHPQVQQSVVIAYESNIDKQLAAYLVVENEISIDELHSYLLESLPAYMVPTYFTFLDAFPVLPNGKLDRKALSEPDQSMSHLEKHYVAPRNEMESAIEVIMADVLKLEKVGVHDSFFDLGGHSLLATQIISRIRQQFEIEITLRSFFETPTIAALAEQIETFHWLNKVPDASLPDAGLPGAGLQDMDEREEFEL